MNQLKNLNHWRNAPIITYIMLLINSIAYLWMMFKFGTTESTQALLIAGANYRPIIVMMNEWWRLLTAGFLHIGIEHFALNMLSLYFVGTELERILGRWRYLLIYLIGILGGNIVSFALAGDNTLSAGASTGIFGLFAAYIVLGKLFNYNPYLRERAQTFTLLIGINIFMNVFGGRVDIWGHVGGALFGALATFIFIPKKNVWIKTSQQILAAIAMVALGALLIFIGIRRV